jgi:hypothetical protein
LKRSEEEGVRRLLRIGWRALRAGHPREAGEAFGRVLLRLPDLAEARRGARRARQALAEEQRLMEARSAEAAHDPSRQRVQPAGSLAPVDRPAMHRATPSAFERAARLTRRLETPLVGRRAANWVRPLFAIASAGLLVVTLVVLGLYWDVLVARILKAPAPGSQASLLELTLPQPSRGQVLLAEARRSLERGDPAAALDTLRAISQEDPVFPFADRLRLQILAGGR